MSESQYSMNASRFTNRRSFFMAKTMLPELLIIFSDVSDIKCWLESDNPGYYDSNIFGYIYGSNVKGNWIPEWYLVNWST